MPPTLEQVHDEAVEQYFSRIDDPKWEDLNLPARPHTIFFTAFTAVVLYGSASPSFGTLPGHAGSRRQPQHLEAASCRSRACRLSSAPQLHELIAPPLAACWSFIVAEAPPPPFAESPERLHLRYPSPPPPWRRRLSHCRPSSRFQSKWILGGNGCAGLWESSPVGPVAGFLVGGDFAGRGPRIYPHPGMANCAAQQLQRCDNNRSQNMTPLVATLARTRPCRVTPSLDETAAMSMRYEWLLLDQPRPSTGARRFAGRPGQAWLADIYNETTDSRQGIVRRRPGRPSSGARRGPWTAAAAVAGKLRSRSMPASRSPRIGSHPLPGRRHAAQPPQHMRAHATAWPPQLSFSLSTRASRRLPPAREYLTAERKDKALSVSPSLLAFCNGPSVLQPGGRSAAGSPRHLRFTASTYVADAAAGQAIVGVC
nr:unnamed protein product [Digitaria exilis]